MDNGAEYYRRFLSGDKEALRLIVEEYYGGLCLYLNLFVGNAADSEDMAEETLFQLISKRPAFSGKSSFKTWLYAIGRHTAIRFIRHRSHETVTAEAEAVLKWESGDAERQLLTKERDRKLYEGLSKLKEEYRQALWLRYFEEMDNKSIATVMKKTVYSVEHLLKRAKDALREELVKEGFPYEEY